MWICVKSLKKVGCLNEASTSRTGVDDTSYYVRMVHWSVIRICQIPKCPPSLRTTSQSLVARSCQLIGHVLTHSSSEVFSWRLLSRGCSMSKQNTSELNGLMLFGEFSVFIFLFDGWIMDVIYRVCISMMWWNVYREIRRIICHSSFLFGGFINLLNKKWRRDAKNIPAVQNNNSHHFCYFNFIIFLIFTSSCDLILDLWMSFLHFLIICLSAAATTKSRHTTRLCLWCLWNWFKKLRNVRQKRL